MGAPKKDQDILKALDEMEQVSSQLNTRKAREAALINKHIKPKLEIKRAEVLKQLSRDEFEYKKWKLKNKIFLILTIGAAAEAIIYYRYAKGDLVDFVMMNIVVPCLIGSALAKLNSGGK